MKSSKWVKGRNLLDGGREDGDSSKGTEDKKGNTRYVHFMVVDDFIGRRYKKYERS